MQVGTTKDRGLYNKPLAAVHPGALAAGALPQYNRIHGINFCLELYLKLLFVPRSKHTISIKLKPTHSIAFCDCRNGLIYV